MLGSDGGSCDRILRWSLCRMSGFAAASDDGSGAPSRTRRPAVRPRRQRSRGKDPGFGCTLTLRHMLASTWYSDHLNHNRAPRVLEGSWEPSQAGNGPKTPTNRRTTTPWPTPREGPIRPPTGCYAPLAAKCARGDLNPHVLRTHGPQPRWSSPRQSTTTHRFYRISMIQVRLRGPGSVPVQAGSSRSSA
jgi:hypothetical protein